MTMPGGQDFRLDVEEPPAAPKLSDIKLDSEEVPEELRGKTVTDLLEQQKALRDALKRSEEARQQATTLAELAAKATTAAPAAMPAAASAPAPQVEEFSEERFRQLHEEDPAKALMYGIQQTQRMLERNLAARIVPLQTSTVDAAEQAARAKYAEDFEVLGGEIKQIVEGIPQEARVAALSQPQAWDRIVEFARGKNIEKVIQHRMAKAEADKAAKARADQAAAAAMPNLGGVGSPPIMTENRVPSGAPLWDATTQEIAAKLGLKDKDEYYKWWSR